MTDIGAASAPTLAGSYPGISGFIAEEKQRG